MSANTQLEPGKFPLYHHYSTPTQQIDSAKMGMWAFLVTEVLLFGGLFVAYFIYRYLHPQAYIDAHAHLNVTMGTVNTMVLLVSSLTVALAIRAAQTNEPKQVSIHIIVTLVCAATFMVVKYFEYSHKFHAGLLPGIYFTNATVPNPDQAHIFFGIYFLMTGLHGIHVLIGMGILFWLLIKNMKGHFSSEYYVPLEIGGLYWHLVDVIWIFLFPLLYLIG